MVSTLQKHLGQRVAHFRSLAQLTQEQLAERSGYSVDFIGLIERGINAPTLSRLGDLANALSVKIWHFFVPEELLPESLRKK